MKVKFQLVQPKIELVLYDNKPIFHDHSHNALQNILKFPFLHCIIYTFLNSRKQIPLNEESSPGRCRILITRSLESSQFLEVAVSSGYFHPIPSGVDPISESRPSR